MRLPVSRRFLLTTSILATGVTFMAPTAQAAEWVDTTAVVDQANETLSQFGVTLDRTVAEQFDATANTNIDASISAGIKDGVLPVEVRTQLPYETTGYEDSVRVVEQPLRLLNEAGEVIEEEIQEQVQRALPNYEIRTDIQAQIMAATSGEVLHRVPGSWFNQPAVPVASKDTEAEGRSLFGPGTPIYLGQESLCTLAVTGTDADGRKIGITAGHCGNPGDAVRSADSFWVGEAGTVVASGSNDDYSVIEFGSNAELSNSYNGVSVNAIGGKTANMQEVCKSGVATGYTCGLVWSSDERMTMSQVCAMRGDSGAPVISGGRVVGLVSGGVLPNHDLACQTPLQGPFYMPSLSVNMDRVLAEMDESEGPGRGFTLVGQ